jgi:hypothetical protein
LTYEQTQTAKTQAWENKEGFQNSGCSHARAFRRFQKMGVSLNIVFRSWAKVTSSQSHWQPVISSTLWRCPTSDVSMPSIK